LINFSMVNGRDQLEGEKPLACPVAGCKKRYKNINGMKYHARHGHKKDFRYRYIYLIMLPYNKILFTKIIPHKT